MDDFTTPITPVDDDAAATTPTTPDDEVQDTFATPVEPEGVGESEEETEPLPFGGDDDSEESGVDEELE